jgi:hypothetical protein
MPGARHVVPGTLLLQLIPEGGGCSSRLVQNCHAGQRFTAIYGNWQRTWLRASLVYQQLKFFDAWVKEYGLEPGWHALRLGEERGRPVAGVVGYTLTGRATGSAAGIFGRERKLLKPI